MDKTLKTNLRIQVRDHLQISRLMFSEFNPLNAKCCPHIETSQLICKANQLTRFYVRATLVFNGLSELSFITP